MSLKSRLHSDLAAAVLWRYRSNSYLVRRATAPSRCSPFNPFAVHLVAPGSVTHLLPRRLEDRVYGVLLPGDWDIDAVPIRDTRVGRALTQRFVEGRPWDQTDLHPEAPDTRDKLRGKYRSLGSLEERFTYLDALWTALQEEGYRDPRDLGKPLKSVMSVCVGRHGRLVRNKNGLHRLVMAQLLDLPAVPVRIVAVHVDARTEGVTVQPKLDPSS